MNKLIHILLLFVVVCFPVFGQKIVPTPDDLYNDAVEFMYSGDYYDALLVLLTLHERGYDTPNINYRIGECYLNVPGQKTRSIPFLREAVKNISIHYEGSTLKEEYAPNKALLYLGIAYRLNYDFDNALVYFNDYLKSFDDADTEKVRLAGYHIERCNFARELMAAPARFTADTLIPGHNVSIPRFNPLVTSDEKMLYYMDQLKFYDAVMQSAGTETGWLIPENLTPRIKSDGDHYATGISADGTQLLLTCYDPYLTGEIFTTEYKNGEWSEIKKLNTFVNTVFNETHASLSPDSHSLYFTSDRRGGYGGMDIYRSAKNENGEWNKPVNLGPLINTPYNEETPFVSSDGSKLFFSSQGHYNMGGYDVFYSSLGDDGNWLPPVNIGYPLNTTDDDMFYFPLDSGNIAYQSRFSTNAQTDIVRYTISSFGKPARFMVNGKVDLLNRNVDPSEISVCIIDKHSNDTLATKALNEDGSFRQKLAGGSYTLNFSDHTQLLLSREMNIPEYFPHDNLVIYEEITVPYAVIAEDTLIIRDIRFGFNTSDLDTTYLPDLRKLAGIMEKYPGISIEVNGYADALGSSNYNLKLSRHRGNSVKAFLESRFNIQDRIVVNAYGEDNPVAMNTHADGRDHPEGRYYNRRAEIILVNSPDPLSVIHINNIPETVKLK